MKAIKNSASFILTILTIWFCLCGCTEEIDYQTTDNQEANLILYARSGSIASTRSGENSVDKVRAIVFEVNENSGSLTYIKQLKNQVFTGNEEIRLSFKKCNQVRVMLIANERSQWRLDDPNKSADQIKNLAVVYGDYKQDVDINAPFVMFSESNTLSGQTDNQLTLELVRNIAKINLSLTCKASEVNGLNYGVLKLTGIRIEGMAPQAGLGSPITDLSHTSFEDYLTGKTTELIEGQNYFPVYDANGGFDGFTTSVLSFYVPEHYVTKTDVHTTIKIFGTYTPRRGTSGVPVEYTLPVGKDITQKKIEENLLTPSELTLERNNLYEMKASFKNLLKVSEIYVNVKSWDVADVNGSINEGKQYLNVSDIDPVLGLSNDTVLIQFQSNVSSDRIRVLPVGTVEENGDSFRVNDIFVSLADDKEISANFEFVKDQMWGRLRLLFKPGAAETGKTYTITLAAGNLNRTIRVKAFNTVY